ncbi:MAG: hypothetical protein CMO55_12800 [Verrucomicrobiales bacterium]|nr:hypothetical protein [Verrucomicrobiales bacterium]
MNEELLLTLEFEGTEREEGRILLSEMISKLEALTSSMNAVNRALTHKRKTTLYYRVAELNRVTEEHIFRITVEPVEKNIESRSRIEETHHRFFEELNRIRTTKEPSAEMSDDVIERFQALVNFDQDKFGGVVLRNHQSIVAFDDELKSAISSYLDSSEISYGSVEGRLERINLHGKTKYFVIYPESGPQQIRCEFVSDLKDSAKSALDERVVVSGRKFFRANQPFPHRIKVFEIQTLPQSASTDHLFHMRGESDDPKPSVETIRDLRNDW